MTTGQPFCVVLSMTKGLHKSFANPAEYPLLVFSYFQHVFARLLDALGDG